MIGAATQADPKRALFAPAPGQPQSRACIVGLSSQIKAAVGSPGTNGESVSIGYDTEARPQSTTSPHGAVTTYTYDRAGKWSTATTNGRWVKITIDGLGRTVKVEQGDGGGTKSVVDTQYAPVYIITK
jgi:YD repeat-containing protein